MRSIGFKKLVFCLSLLVIVMASCQEQNKTDLINDSVDLEAREDSLELVKAYQEQSKITKVLFPQVETTPISAESMDDAADDPAIWYNTSSPSESLIFGTNKKGGLAAYNLKGQQVDFYPVGNANNVDILDSIIWEGHYISILGCTNRTFQSVQLFGISRGGKLFDITKDTIFIDAASIDDVYGFCFARNREHSKDYFLVNGKNGVLQQFEFGISNSNQLVVEKVREMSFSSQIEGMVAHNSNGVVYVGEEDKGVWRINLDPLSKDKILLEMSGESNPNIKYDIEGLTIYSNDSISVLIASSQGNFSYAVFDLNNNEQYLTSFKVLNYEDIDGVEETDGLDFASDSLSTDYPKGIMVFQDGFNYRGDTLLPQNFKFLDARDFLNNLTFDH